MDRRKFLKRSAATTAVVAVGAQLKSDSTLAAQAKGTRAKSKTGRRKVITNRAPLPAGPYSQAIVAGNTIYVAGQVPYDPQTGKMVTGPFEDHAVRAFENVKAILEAAGATTADVVKVNVYLTDLANFAKMNEVYRRYFSEDFPARTTVGVQLSGELQIEVDCVAVK